MDYCKHLSSIIIIYDCECVRENEREKSQAYYHILIMIDCLLACLKTSKIGNREERKRAVDVRRVKKTRIYRTANGRLERYLSVAA